VNHADRRIADDERTLSRMLSVTGLPLNVVGSAVRSARTAVRRVPGDTRVLPRRRDAAARRLARLLLVACTVIGVAALHTIGHATAGDEHTTIGSATSSAVAVLIAPSSLVADTTSDGGCDGDGCTHQIALPDSGRTGSSGWEVCVAILSALAVIVLAAGMHRLFPIIRLAEVASRRRPPPFAWVTAPPAGLTIAATAILRI
jgi:hypothetical protein